MRFKTNKTRRGEEAFRRLPRGAYEWCNMRYQRITSFCTKLPALSVYRKVSSFTVGFYLLKSLLKFIPKYCSIAIFKRIIYSIWYYFYTAACQVNSPVYSNQVWKYEVQASWKRVAAGARNEHRACARPALLVLRSPALFGSWTVNNGSSFCDVDNALNELHSVNLIFAFRR